VASRMNCRCPAPVPFTALGRRGTLCVTIDLVRDLTRTVSHQPFRRIRPAETSLDQQRFGPVGKLVVGNLDRITNIDNVGN
jgi:hypothetical protein